MGRWRPQQTARRHVNCRTHDHWHVERILRLIHLVHWHFKLFENCIRYIWLSVVLSLNLNYRQRRLHRRAVQFSVIEASLPGERFMTKVLLSVYALHHIMFTMSWVSYVALTLLCLEFSCLDIRQATMCSISMKSIVDGKRKYETWESLHYILYGEGDYWATSTHVWLPPEFKHIN